MWHHSIARLATSWKTSELQWSIYFLKHGWLADYQKNSKRSLPPGADGQGGTSGTPDACCISWRLFNVQSICSRHLGRLVAVIPMRCLRVALTLVHGWWALSFPASALDVSSGPGRCVALWCNSMMLSGAIQPRTLVDLYMQTADLYSKKQSSNVTNHNLIPQPWTIGYRKLRSSGTCTLSVVFLLGCKRNQEWRK